MKLEQERGARVAKSFQTEAARLPIAMLGVPFENATMAESLRLIEQMLMSGRPHYVVTANVDFLVQARNDAELRRIFVDAPLVLCDGMHLVWLSRILGNPLPERVAGSDLTPRLLRFAEEGGHSVYFLGGTPDVLEQALANVRERFPKLNIAGHWSPPFDPLLKMNHEKMTERIRAACPDILFVAFGCPKAEKWMAMHYRTLGVPVMVGIGGSLDFLAGHRRRAPVWMQKSGLEWLCRLAQEPRRLGRRYSVDMWRFGCAMTAHWAVLRAHPACTGKKKNELHSLSSQAGNRVRVKGRLDASAVEAHREQWETLAENRAHCLLNLSEVTALDSTGAAMLLRLRRLLRENGHHLVLVAASRPARRALEFMRVWDCFFRTVDEVIAFRLLEQLEAQRATHVLTGNHRNVVWQGEVTAANAELVWGQTQMQLDQSFSVQDQVIVDLSRVRFIDSSGVGVLLRAKDRVSQNGSALRFRGASPVVRDVLIRSSLEEQLLTELS